MNLSDLPLAIRHAVNTSGRDFVVGDLHGCRSMLERLLVHVQFDPSRDRVFATGDLVDRGPDSLGTLQLLREPWFYSVLGNHDAMLLAYLGRLDNRGYAKAFVLNGGLEWAKGLTDDQLEQAADLLMDVPFIRIVGEKLEERFQVLHAERASFDDEISLSDAELDNPGSELAEKLQEVGWITGFDMYGSWYDRLLWGRSLRRAMVEESSEFRPELSRTFVGHTITVGRNLSIYGYAGHVFLDTGAYQADDPERPASFGLTLWEVTADFGVQLRSDGFHKVHQIA